MKTSIIIPTYDGAHKIPLLLDVLLKQTFFDFEIIVVVDGSTDNTIEVLHRYKNKFNSLRIIEQANTGRSKVKNRGAKEAQGELLVFYDDDMIPSPDSVKKHYEFHTQYRNSILSGNQVETTDPQKTDIQNYKASLTKKWTAKYTQDITQLNTNNLFFSAANCSIPRKIFEQLNGFDDRLTDAEDFDFAYRSIEKNIPVWFDQTNVAIHNDSITCTSYIKRIREYQQAHQKLNELHPERKSTVHTSKKFKLFIYRLFAYKFFPKVIDNTKLFMIFPIKIRYRLYSIIIQSLAVEYTNVAL
jgi:glycosyltransferase involved in cell wall biosynthesis